MTEFGDGLTSYFAILSGQVLADGQPPRFFTYSNTIGLADHITERETFLYVLDEAARANDCEASDVVLLFYRAVPNRRDGEGDASTVESPWLTAEELRVDPILCEECGEPAEFHGVDGWLCGPCDEEMRPRYEG